MAALCPACVSGVAELGVVAAGGENVGNSQTSLRVFKPGAEETVASCDQRPTESVDHEEDT